MDAILAENEKQVAAYRGGKTKLQGFFVGQVGTALLQVQIVAFSEMFKASVCRQLRRPLVNGLVGCITGNEGVRGTSESCSTQQDTFS